MLSHGPDPKSHQRKRLAQTEATKRCGVTYTRLSDLYCGRLHQFSIAVLRDMVTLLGRKLRIAITVKSGRLKSANQFSKGLS